MVKNSINGGGGNRLTAPAKTKIKNEITREGFTLAEVLITLGIIGIVAAMTMPALLAQHRKQVIVAKLEKFYSTMGQAIITATAEQGASPDQWDTFSSAYNGDEMQAWFDKYLKKHLQILEEKKKGDLVYVALADGTGLVIFNHSTGVGGIHTYFCTDYKKCKNTPDGKDVFTFMFYKNGFSTYGQANGLKREQLMNPSLDCTCSKEQSYPHYCSTLIQMDGWKISNDYPIKI